MRVRNLTGLKVENVLWDIVFRSKVETAKLRVRILWIRQHALASYSGVFKSKENLICVRINKKNTYPHPVQMGTGEWFENPDGSYFQILKTVKVRDAIGLCALIFAHELSHYIDHIEGRNMRYKQTKADRWSHKICKDIGLIDE